MLILLMKLMRKVLLGDSDEHKKEDCNLVLEHLERPVVLFWIKYKVYSVNAVESNVLSQQAQSGALKLL